jgi:hypothetical protein
MEESVLLSAATAYMDVSRDTPGMTSAPGFVILYRRRRSTSAIIHS